MNRPGEAPGASSSQRAEAAQAAGFYKNAVQESELQQLRQQYRHVPVSDSWLAALEEDTFGEEYLDCPSFELPSWFAGVMSSLTILAILICFGWWRWRKTTLKARRAEEAISDQGKRLQEQAQLEREAITAAPRRSQKVSSGLLGETGGAQNLVSDIDVVGPEAFLPLQQLQSQTAEDLWTRDSGSLAQLEMQIQEISEEADAMAGQFDFLQQRVQSQDVIGNAVHVLQRRCARSLEDVESWQVGGAR